MKKILLQHRSVFRLLKPGVWQMYVEHCRRNLTKRGGMSGCNTELQLHTGQVSQQV